MRPPSGVALSLAVLLFAQAGQAQTAAKEAAPPPAALPPGVSAALWKLSVPASLAPTPERVLLGEKLFNGKARCNSCHAGNVVSPLFSDQKFHNIGIAAHKQDFVKLAREALKVVCTGDEQQIARGRPLADGDPRMRAMEAYIYAKRKGVKLDYGKK